MLEADAPRRLSHTWTSLYDPEMAVEEPSRVTWEIEARDDGTALLTVTHDQLEGAPKTAVGLRDGMDGCPLIAEDAARDRRAALGEPTQARVALVVPRAL